MATRIIIPRWDEVLQPSDLGEEYYATDTLPAATKPAQFVGFLCFVCGERHSDLGALMDCHTNKQNACASAPILQVA